MAIKKIAFRSGKYSREQILIIVQRVLKEFVVLKGCFTMGVSGRRDVKIYFIG